MSAGGGGYTFGDTDLAAERLALVADVFAATSRRLMLESIPAPAELVLDLGCGPGHTTRLLSEVSPAPRIIGLDASERHVSLAGRLTVDSRVEFTVHDVTRLPFPSTPADAIYCRFLLSHLREPARLVDSWRSQLRPGGVLVLDELEAIDAPPGPLRTYVELATDVVATSGGSLYAGVDLRRFGGRVEELRVPVRTAAGMFAMNVDALRRVAVEHGLADDKRLDGLVAQLDNLSSSVDDVPWFLRQVVVQV